MQPCRFGFMGKPHISNSAFRITHQASKRVENLKRAERAEFNTIKQKVQEFVLSNRFDGSWNITLPENMRSEMIMQLKERIKNLGFEVDHKSEKREQDGPNTWYTEPAHLLINLPVVKANLDDGKVCGLLDSEGWLPGFRADKIQDTLQKVAEGRYHKLSASIADNLITINEHVPLRVDVDGEWSIVLDWIIQDLKELGYESKVVTVSGRNETDTTLEILLPKIKLDLTEKV